MGIVKTKLVNLTSDLTNLDKVLMRFVDFKNFHPVLASKIVDRVRGLTTFTADNPCSSIIKELDEIENVYGYSIEAVEVRNLDYDFDRMRNFIATTHKKLKDRVDELKNIEESIKKHNDALIQVTNIERLDISLDDVFSCKYISARVGRLPTDSIEKLRFYRSRPFLFKSFNVDQNYSWCMYFTTNEYEREVDNIFSSLFFERIHIPDFVHGTPEKAVENLQTEISNLQNRSQEIKNEMKAIFDECGYHLGLIKGELLFLDKIFEAKKYVIGLGDRFTISGFIEDEHVEEIEQQFNGIDDLEIEIRPADSDKRIVPPTKLKNGWFSRPFSMFVEMYGLPGYRDFDPTPFVAITYSLLFGIMFGDLGQGLVLMLLGYILYKWKKMKLGEIAIRIGLFSALFGILFGSFFGNEEILNPFYTEILGLPGKPIHVMDSNFTMTLLIGAIAIGATLIIISMILNIYIKIKQKHILDVLFSANGFTGLAFYLFIFVGIILTFLFEINIFNIITILLFIGLPILLIFLKEPLERLIHKEKMFPSGFVGFVIEGFMELFDVFLTYITNTMSFMRVGGFVLSHAGMMLVVYTLMEMVGGFGSTIVLIFGNIFVMALEGMIVGIQVLRLEFYEMFSRYYEGNGIAFETLD